MKRYWDLHYQGDASQFTVPNTTPAPAARAPATTASPKRPASPRVQRAPAPAAAPAAKRDSTSTISGAPARAPRKENTPPAGTTAPAPTAQVSPPGTSMDASKAHEQALLIAELRVTCEGIEKERDFYFNKLREIEGLCEANVDEASKPFAAKVQAVLFSTDEPAAGAV